MTKFSIMVDELTPQQGLALLVLTEIAQGMPRERAAHMEMLSEGREVEGI